MLAITSLAAILLSIRLITTGEIGYGVGLIVVTLFFQFLIYIINWVSSDMDD